MWPLATGHFQMVQEQKNKVEVDSERTNLNFSLFVRRKLQTSPRSLVSFLIFCSSKIRNWPIGCSPWFLEYDISI